MSSIMEDEMTDPSTVEHWKSVVRSRHGVIRSDPSGRDKAELIRGGATFSITVADREMTSRKIGKAADDPFENGAFIPEGVEREKRGLVVFWESDDQADDDPSEPLDHPATLGSPTHLTDDEIASLLEQHHNTMTKQLADIDSPFTLRRILEAAKATDASPARMTRIQARIDELNPRTQRTTRHESSLDAAPLPDTSDPNRAGPARTDVPDMNAPPRGF